MKQLNINFTPKFNGKAGIIDLLSRRFRVEVTPHCDYYFIGGDTRYANKFRSLQPVNPDAIRILWCFEASYPDLNLFDYAIGFPKDVRCPDRLLELAASWQLEQDFDMPQAKLDPKRLLQEKIKFCNFIYGRSRENEHKKRDDIFHALSGYKQVDALGGQFNNVSIPNTRHQDNWFDVSITLKSPYKFSIAGENTRFPGYTTEKIVSSMRANTIPIYWGNLQVTDEYNPKSFINAHDYPTLDALVQRVREIDQDNNLWCDMMREPWRTLEQVERANSGREHFYESFYAIFEQDIEESRKRPRGPWVKHLYGSVAVPCPKKTLRDIWQSVVSSLKKNVRGIVKLFSSRSIR